MRKLRHKLNLGDIALHRSHHSNDAKECKPDTLPRRRLHRMKLTEDDSQRLVGSGVEEQKTTERMLHGVDARNNNGGR